MSVTTMTLRVPDEVAPSIRAAAAEAGLSVNAYVVRAGRSDGGDVMLAPADVQAEEDIEAVVAADVQAGPAGLRSALSGHRSAASS
ncbi:toxin-antitoxin system HicB family antitoxin [Streptomyces flaveolus]|uniref:toxin-antitoxin system HicB family antitoxin n=1 Tax=Streptomyces flaveolus TaxID=67297 RepID=UPI003423C72A